MKRTLKALTKFFLFTSVFTLASTNYVNGQLFLETFNEANTSTSGFDDIGGVAWSSTCTGCVSGDYWHVLNGVFEGNDTNGEAVWETTGSIDISSCAKFNIKVDIESLGNMEGCNQGCNATDWIYLQYNIDNTGWQDPTNAFFCAGLCADLNIIHEVNGPGNSVSYQTGCIDGGSSLQIRIGVQCWSQDEFWRIDNVLVECGSNPSVDAGSNLSVCNGTSVTLTASNPDNADISWNFGINDGLPFTPTVGSVYFTTTATLGTCSAQDSVLVTVVPGPDFNVNAGFSSTCTPPFDGIITISNLSPGQFYDLTYVLDGNVVGPTNYQANGSGQIVLLSMPPGDYQPIIIDSLGCNEVNTVGVTITQPPLPGVTAHSDAVICEGDSVLLYADNPDNAVISWDNGVNDSVWFTPSVGTITYHVTANDLGCIGEDSVDVTVIPVVTVNLPAQGPFAVFDPVQNLTATPAGGTWSASCGSCINTSTGAFDPGVAGIGFHQICYTAGIAPCQDVQCIDIYVSDGCNLTGTINPSNPTCNGFSDGSATINMQFATGNIVFVIKDSLGNVVNTANSNTANNLSEGWYYFTVTDDFPCTFIDSVFIDDPDQMTVDFNIQDPTCYGVDNGLVIADTVYNATGNYALISYNWNPNPSGSNGIGEDSLINVGEGQYTLTVNDENGCSELIDFTVTYPDSLYFTELGSNPAYCRVYEYQQGNGSVFVAGAGGTPDYDYLWLNLQDSSTSVNSTWSPLNYGDYKVTVTDQNGCTLVAVITVDSLNPLADFDMASPEFSAEWEGTAPVTVTFSNLSQYFANPNNPAADTTFWWNFGEDDVWQLSNSLSEEFEHTYTSGGTFNACLVAVNKNGCTDTLCVPIVIYDLDSFTPINVFTPNGDGVNDVFTFMYSAVAISEFNCVILNRWGRVVHEMNSINDYWDGTDKSGSKCPEGVYFYSYKATAQNGDSIEGQGNIHLVGSK
ncbi:MAG: gliding motility-associated C-terminal domain-containing protein [Crocinitomicaceae bacterium]|nr:gliding motility-associated C-terminal domain-containing protein [Crocinitomicaceae bacterium]